MHADIARVLCTYIYNYAQKPAPTPPPTEHEPQINQHPARFRASTSKSLFNVISRSSRLAEFQLSWQVENIPAEFFKKDWGYGDNKGGLRRRKKKRKKKNRITIGTDRALRRLSRGEPWVYSRGYIFLSLFLSSSPIPSPEFALGS